MTQVFDLQPIADGAGEAPHEVRAIAWFACLCSAFLDDLSLEIVI